MELEIHKETVLFDLENQKTDLGIKQIAIKEDAKYDFRAQMIILFMIVILLATTVLLAFNGHERVACFVAVGGFAAIVIAAIKGVSNKTK